MLARPERFFEDRFGLTSSAMERLLGSQLAGRVDHADLFLEYRISEELALEDGAVKKASRHVSQGAGIRAQSGERTGYAHTDDLALPNLEEAARQAMALGRGPARLERLNRQIDTYRSKRESRVTRSASHGADVHTTGRPAEETA